MAQCKGLFGIRDGGFPAIPPHLALICRSELARDALGFSKAKTIASKLAPTSGAWKFERVSTPPNLGVTSSAGIGGALGR
jgi:hypothetical protein